MIPEMADALGNFAPFVDSKTGLIKSVELIKVSESDPQVFMAHANPSDTTPLTGLPAANRGAAASAIPERAIVRACGESIERYCSAIFDVQLMLLASERDLTTAKERFVRVSEVYPFTNAQYAEEGFPFKKAEPDTKIRWVKGQALSTGQDVWLPASCVYVPYLFDAEVEPWTHMPISTGLAAGPSIHACIQKGIYEIIERDALMLVWYARMPTQRIDPESCFGITPEIDALIETSSSHRATWHLSVLTLDIDIPVIGAALIDADGLPRTSFGISSDEDPQRSLMLALEEAVLTRLLVNRSEEVQKGTDEYSNKELKTLRDHLLAHATSRELRERLCFMTDDGPLIRFEDLNKHCDKGESVEIEKRLSEIGYDVFWVDVTTPDVRECGIHVARTIIPRMQPLDNDHRYRYLGGARLLSIPRSLGFPIESVDLLNQDPHPFP